MKAVWLSVLVLCAVASAQDTDPPYVDEIYPEDGDPAPDERIIIFHCKDTESPVDLDTIDFTVWEDWPWLDRSITVDAVEVLERTPKVISTVPGDLDIDDTDPQDVVCTFVPEGDLPEFDHITCTVAGGLADIYGNEMVDDFVWEFWVDVKEASWGEVKAREW
ncbi:MAG TPA: hypothetical protein VM054_02350 [bacterium]|nr:hypothetical protein [bacterium]